MSDIDDIKMTSSRPYLLRAMYEWIVENGLTPHLLVFADQPGVIVPRQSVDDGKIVLNIGPTAVRGLVLGNTDVTFSGRFGGMAMNVVVPVVSAAAIYTRENGKGMVFSAEGESPEGTPPSEGNDSPPAGKKENKRPALRVVK